MRVALRISDRIISLARQLSITETPFSGHVAKILDPWISVENINESPDIDKLPWTRRQSRAVFKLGAFTMYRLWNLGLMCLLRPREREEGVDWGVADLGPNQTVFESM